MAHDSGAVRGAVVTGAVVAVSDLDQARALWEGVFGLEPAPHGVDPAGQSSYRDPETGAVVTLVPLAAPDPTHALAVRVRDMSASVEELARHGFHAYWRDTSRHGTDFVMCRGEHGMSILLYAQGDS